MTDIDWKGRALAAERTVDVLKRKVRELYNGGGSSIQHTVERARAREAEMRRREELAELRNAELVRHSAALEGEVAARTRDIKTILDHVTFGFLVVGRDGAVRDGSTRSCVELLGRDGLAGCQLSSVLGLDDRTRMELDLQLEQLFMDWLPSEVVIDQMPRRAVGRGGAQLRLDVRPIRSEAGELDGALVTITDVTALLAAERDNAHYRRLVSILRQRDAFGGFVADFRVVASDGRSGVLKHDEEVARRAMHTIKGNAACFGLAEIAELAHAAEEHPSLGLADFDRVEGALDEFLAKEAATLGTDVEADTVRVRASELAELASARSLAEVAAWARRMHRRPIRLMIGPLESLVERLATRFGKDVELSVEGEHLRVDTDIVAPVVRELGHLVRNAIDHGIEPACERTGKTARGHLRLRFREDPSAVHIDVEDDGRGIDVARVVAKARERGLCDDATLSALDRRQLLGLVFLDGVTTAEAATDISGRGIGMSAVRAAVLRAGGTISIVSEIGAGTRIEIVLPAASAQSHAA